MSGKSGKYATCIQAVWQYTGLRKKCQEVQGNKIETVYNSEMKRFSTIIFVLIFLSLWVNPIAAQEEPHQHVVEPGDTWLALSYRYGTAVDLLQTANPFINRQREPVIGTAVVIPSTAEEQTGSLVRTEGMVWATAVSQAISPWQIAQQNGLASPYHPLLYQPLFTPGGNTPPRDLPIGFTQLELSQLHPQPGQAVGLRGIIGDMVATTAVTAVLDGEEMDSFSSGPYLVALTGKGAFWGNGVAELAIRIEGRPLWSQPWQFTDPDLWQYQEITLTGTAAEIDQASIETERERLFAIWEQNSPQPQWTAPFQYPITDYLEITSPFGARRSYNGGPYRTYHEGVDFSAYGGTAVSAPAVGTVVLAEPLYVRGGAVIIDHGLGIYTGYYHLSEVLAAVGDVVQPGQVIGAVGTTGLSTGNHLHWDLLVDGVWVDAQAWVEQDMACWLLAGMGMPCQ